MSQYFPDHLLALSGSEFMLETHHLRVAGINCLVMRQDEGKGGGGHSVSVGSGDGVERQDDSFSSWVP